MNKLVEFKQLLIILSLMLIVGVRAYKVNAQNTVDSLKNILKTAKEDTTRCKIYLKIGDVFEYENPDTALYFYNQSLQLANLKKLKKQEAKALNYIGIVQSDQGNYEQAITYYLKALKISEKLGNKKEMFSNYNNIGVVNYSQSNYDQAIRYYLKS